MIDDVKYDVLKIKLEINRLAAEIRALKKEIRQPNVVISWNQAATLSAAKEEVTELCVLQAARRGKMHFTGIGGEQRQKEIMLSNLASFVRQYRLVEPAGSTEVSPTTT